MDTIDHAILIPKSPTFIWNRLSDIRNNTRWQVNCESVSFLTTNHSGPGVRWRYTTSNKRDYVIETTAWYEGLGYEYRIVDGAPYKQNTGRIRLQEVAEGTIVQWTFTYEPTGLLGGLRNSLRQKRRIKADIAESLRGLYRYIMEQAHEDFQPTARVLMRDAPDVEQRSKYQPRHPSALADDNKTIIDEPPITEDDTRPRPSVMKADILPEKIKQPLDEPSFLANIPDKPVYEPTNPPETIAPLPDNAAKPPTQPIMAERSTITEPTETREINPAPPPPKSESPEMTTRELDKVELERLSNLPTDIRDTSQISVFELFGLPKPSETQEMAKLILTQQPKTEPSTLPHRRRLFRMEQRHRMKKLRRRNT